MPSESVGGPGGRWKCCLRLSCYESIWKPGQPRARSRGRFQQHHQPPEQPCLSPPPFFLSSHPPFSVLHILYPVCTTLDHFSLNNHTIKPHPQPGPASHYHNTGKISRLCGVMVLAFTEFWCYRPIRTLYHVDQTCAYALLVLRTLACSSLRTLSASQEVIFALMRHSI